MRFVDLFAGLGGFHYALRALGHECVFASEIDRELRELYALNFKDSATRIAGDIRQCWAAVPPHDILCAGFPCQPFSKSGSQLGRRDRTRGTLFAEILKVIRRRRPNHVVLENVGNFERHDSGRTWRIVQESLAGLGYDVRGTVHVTSGGHGLVSPHHLGYPQTRERFFIVASQRRLPEDPFPKADRSRVTDLGSITQRAREITELDRAETALSPQQVTCIEHWNRFIKAIPADVELPSFPLWGDEFGARYPYEKRTPFKSPTAELTRTIPHPGVDRPTRHELLALLPAYARRPDSQFPEWKIRFIRRNRDYFGKVRSHLPSGWRQELSCFPASLRKLEWNCSGEQRDLWSHVLQFRPSGLRVKRYTSAPALVAMTVTQIPILGPQRRFLTRTEGLRLQGFPDEHRLPKSRERAFAALGNAVHTGVACAVVHRLLTGRAHELEQDAQQWLPHLARPREATA